MINQHGFQARSLLTALLLAATAVAGVFAPEVEGSTLAPATFEEYIYSPQNVTGLDASSPETISVDFGTGSASVTTSAGPPPIASIAAETTSGDVELSGFISYQFQLVASPGVEIPDGTIVTVLLSFLGAIDVIDPASQMEASIGASVTLGSASPTFYDACVSTAGSPGCASTSVAFDTGSIALQMTFLSNVSNIAQVDFSASGWLGSGKFGAWIDPLPFIDPTSTINGVIINASPQPDGIPAIEVVQLELSEGVAVPEPGTLAWLAVGLGALGGATLRRRR